MAQLTRGLRPLPVCYTPTHGSLPHRCRVEMPAPCSQPNPNRNPNLTLTLTLTEQVQAQGGMLVAETGKPRTS